MEPRADFSCRSCAKAAGEDGLHVHVDLPVASKRCPISGSKINRLFNAVNVGNASARAHAKIVENSSIPAQMDAAKERKQDVLNIGAGSALGAVQGFPGAALHSRGGVDSQGQRVYGSVDVLKTLRPPRPLPG